jgi:hypothetical protein
MLLLGLVVPLALGEAALRSFGPILPGNYFLQIYAEPDPIYGNFRAVDRTGWVKTEEFISQVNINSLGLRERDLDYPKPPGAQRMLVVGDSFVEGVQVPVEQVASRRAEELLVSRGCPVQTINAGVGGWGTTEEYLYLKHEGLQFQPDQVIAVFYSGNDVTNNSPYIKSNVRNFRRPYYEVGNDGRLRQLPWRSRRPDENLETWLRRNSLFFSVLDTGALMRLRAHFGDPIRDEEDTEAYREQRLLDLELPVFSATTPRNWQSAWEVTEALLVAMRDETVAAGVPFLLVYAPTIWEIYPNEWELFRTSKKLKETGWDFDGPNRRVTEIAARNGIDFLDLRQPLRAAAPTSPPLYFRHDLHWTAAGHAVVAEALASRWVGRCG